MTRTAPFRHVIVVRAIVVVAAVVVSRCKVDIHPYRYTSKEEEKKTLDYSPPPFLLPYSSACVCECVNTGILNWRSSSPLSLSLLNQSITQSSTMSAVQAATSAYHELMQLYEQKELIHRLVANNNAAGEGPQNKSVGNLVDRPDSSTISPPPVPSFADHLTTSNDKPIALKKIPFSLHSSSVVSKDNMPSSPPKMEKNNHIGDTNRTSPVPGGYPNHVTGTYCSCIPLEYYYY